MRRIWKILLIAALAGLAAAQILFFSPSNLEESDGTTRGPIDPSELVNRVDGKTPNLAPDLPKGKIPEYEVNDFTYVSTQNGVRQWKIAAKRAFFYQKEKIVHSKTVIATLYDTDGSETIIDGMESKYRMDQKDLEIFGAATATLPDGFKVHSEYMHYNPNSRVVTIPDKFAVQGEGAKDEKTGEKMSFTSMGMTSNMTNKQIVLPRLSHVIREIDGTDEKGKPKKEITTIDSDRCKIDRSIQFASFEMEDERKEKDRFVIIRQDKMNAKGRRAEMKYGDPKNSGDKLQQMSLLQDVAIRDLGSKPPQYSTSGRADFDKRRDIIILTEFPQVYQGGDTVTGERILLHRATNIVEVEESNAFKGEEAPNSQAPGPNSDLFNFPLPAPPPSPTMSPGPSVLPTPKRSE